MKSVRPRPSRAAFTFVGSTLPVDCDWSGVGVGAGVLSVFRGVGPGRALLWLGLAGGASLFSFGREVRNAPRTSSCSGAVHPVAPITSSESINTANTILNLICPPLLRQTSPWSGTNYVEYVRRRLLDCPSRRK